MPAVQCPIVNCNYVTPDLDAAIVAALITAHCTSHSQAAAIAAKVERVKRPTICPAGSNEDWSYFLSRWTDYAIATKIEGQDKVTQLLECCDEPLRKDLRSEILKNCLQLFKRNKKYFTLVTRIRFITRGSQ